MVPVARDLPELREVDVRRECHRVPEDGVVLPDELDEPVVDDRPALEPEAAPRRQRVEARMKG